MFSLNYNNLEGDDFDHQHSSSLDELIAHVQSSDPFDSYDVLISCSACGHYFGNFQINHSSNPSGNFPGKCYVDFGSASYKQSYSSLKDDLEYRFQCECQDQVSALINANSPEFPLPITGFYSNSRVLSHNEHLVGVELNPGPIIEDISGSTAVILRSGTKGKKRKSSAVVASPPKRQKKNNGNNRPRRNASQGIYRMPPITTAYLRMLCDPVENGAVPAGFMTYSPTITQDPYLRQITTISGTDLRIIINPDASLSSSISGVSNYLNNFVTVIQIGGTVSAYAAVNRASIIANTTTNRTLACGIKLEVAHATTAQSGIIGLIRYNGMTSATSLDNVTPSQAVSLPYCRQYQTLAGTCTVKNNWLPSDATDFEFANNAVYNNGEGVYNPIEIVLTGFPTGTRVSFQVIAHLECQQGVNVSGGFITEEKTDFSGTSQAFQPALIDEHPSSDTFIRRSSEVISNVSSNVEWATSKVNEISDVIGKAAGLYKTAESMFNFVSGIAKL